MSSVLNWLRAEAHEQMFGDKPTRDGRIMADWLDQAADEIERLRVIETEARKVVDLLRDVGQDTDWRDGTETDRVFAWYEFDGLRSALGEKDSGMTKGSGLIADESAAVTKEQWDALLKPPAMVTLCGIPLHVIPGGPENEVAFYQDGKLVGRIVLEKNSE